MQRKNRFHKDFKILTSIVEMPELLHKIAEWYEPRQKDITWRLYNRINVDGIDYLWGGFWHDGHLKIPVYIVSYQLKTVGARVAVGVIDQEFETIYEDLRNYLTKELPLLD